ncbi:MAG: hypothetical protein EAZ23_22615 [Oscillatoriales cyanobacterium]|nr:MAG: hypothetical protein EAZ23_22615 [Oscillatoriales cyanobacterium]
MPLDKNTKLCYVKILGQLTHSPANYQLPITNYQLPITNYRLPITDYQLPITNYQLPITHYQSVAPSLHNFYMPNFLSHLLSQAASNSGRNSYLQLWQNNL